MVETSVPRLRVCLVSSSWGQLALLPGGPASLWSHSWTEFPVFISGFCAKNAQITKPTVATEKSLCQTGLRGGDPGHPGAADRPPLPELSLQGAGLCFPADQAGLTAGILGHLMEWILETGFCFCSCFLNL